MTISYIPETINLFESSSGVSDLTTALKTVVWIPGYTLAFDFVMYDSCSNPVVTTDAVRLDITENYVTKLALGEIATANGSIITNLGNGRYRVRLVSADHALSLGTYTLRFSIDTIKWHREIYFLSVRY